MIFEVDTSSLTIALLGVNLLAAIFLCTLYRGRIRRVVSHGRLSRRAASGDLQSGCPGISVVVYDRDSTDSLARMLPELLAQNYPGGYEVIVATDGRSESASDMVKILSAEHRNLRLTFVPDEAHALSRKKLALTLGIKAARYDYVLLTDAEATVPSRDWLSAVGRHFVDGRDVVIGHAHPVDRRGRSGSMLVAFDTLADDVTFLSAAIGGKPYRGSEKNLGFKRSLFFENKGFAGSVGFHHGEDDIFVSSIANTRNTAVELGGQAQVALGCYDLRSQHREHKLRHLFTGRYVSGASRLFFGLCSAMMWLWVATAAAVALTTLPNLFPLAVAVAAGIAWIVTGAVAWNAAARVLSIRVAPWTLPVAMLLRPIYNFIYRLMAKGRRDRNYTWSKP